MTPLILAGAGLFVLLAMVVLFPGRGQRPVDESARDEARRWLKQRQGELEGDAELVEALERDAQLRVLEDVAPTASADAPEASSAGRFSPAWVLLPAVLLALGLYWQLGSATDVVLARELADLGGTNNPDAAQTLIAKVEARAAARPDNLYYQALLGRYYMGQEDYARAAALYDRLAEASPGDPHAQAFAAQASFLQAGRVLSPQAQVRAERALSLDPNQRTALGLLGMAAFEQQQYRAAIQYWERLRATEQPGSEAANMIAGVISAAQQRLEESGAALPDEGQGSAGAPTADGMVRIALSLPQGMEVDPNASVFVLARGADAASRMPIAVQRLRAADLPQTLSLSDANSMAGQLLSTAGEVLVVAQLSPSGQPGAGNASHLAQLGPLVPGDTETVHSLVLQPNPDFNP